MRFKKYSFALLYFRPIMRHTRDIAEVEELSEAEFTHYADSPAVSFLVFCSVFRGITLGCIYKKYISGSSHTFLVCRYKYLEH